MTKKYMPPAKVIASAPCRIDCGGTLDILPLSLSLSPHRPCSFNIALNIRTEVEVKPNPGGGLVVESVGFETETALGDHDYNSPMGFFFQACDHFGLTDLSISIKSGSPPRSALGGSSVALVATVAALAAIAPHRRMNRFQVVDLAHKLEEALFQIPCGVQDQLAAAYGGVHMWTWTPAGPRPWRATKLIKGDSYPRLEKRILVAYPGQTHSSTDVNGRWIKEFVKGSTRPVWREIIDITRKLAQAVSQGHWVEAGQLLNIETELRLDMTPDVLTDTGHELYEAAKSHNVGARFTGAGGGGCLWALGRIKDIEALRPVWQDILSNEPEAELLPTKIDRLGLKVVSKRGG